MKSQELQTLAVIYTVFHLSQWYICGVVVRVKEDIVQVAITLLNVLILLTPSLTVISSVVPMEMMLKDSVGRSPVIHVRQN